MIKYLLIKSIRKNKKPCPEKGKDWINYNIMPAYIAAQFLAEQVPTFMKERKKAIFKSPLRLEILGYSDNNETTCIKLIGAKQYISDFIQELAVHEEFNTHWYWREIDCYDAKIELKY